MQKTKIVESKDQLLKAIKPLTFLLGIMGIRDVLYKNVIYCCYAFLLFILHWSILIYMALFLEIIGRPHKSIFDIINAFHVFTEPFSIIIIMCFSFFSSEKSSYLLSQIAENDQILQKLGTNIDYTKLSKRLMLSYVIYVFILTSLFTVDYMILFVWTTHEVFLFTSWLVTLIYVTINTTCLMLLMFMTALIKVRFQLLNKLLSGIRTVNVDYLLKETIPVKKNSERISVQQMIEMIKDLHDKYIKICLTLLKKMDIVNVIQIGSLVVSLTGNIYIVLGMLMDQEYTFNIIVYCLYWSVFKVLRLCLMVYVFSDVCYEANRTSIVIHDIVNRGEDNETYIYLKNFSMQLLHQKLKMTASDLFPIDYTLLYSVCGTVTTYLVILIQFKIANTTTSLSTNSTTLAASNVSQN